MFKGRIQLHLCLALLLTLLHSSTLYAEPSRCNAAITTLKPVASEADPIMPVEYVYDVTFDEHCQLRPVPVLSEVMDCKRPQVELKPGSRNGSLNAHATVSCVFRRPGHYYLPPVKFELTAPDNSVETLHPNLHYLTIPYRKDFHDTDIDLENTLVLLSWTQHLRQIWRILLAVIVGILAVTTLYFKHQKNKTLPEKHAKAQSPIEEFMAEIKALQTMSPVSMDDYKVFHDKLSHGVKTYISRRLGSDVMSLTSIQVCAQLKKLGVSSELCQDAKRLLRSSACIRFAQYVPKYSDNLALLNETVELVEKLEAFAKEKEKIQTVTPASQNAETENAPTTDLYKLFHPDKPSDDESGNVSEGSHGDETDKQEDKNEEHHSEAKENDTDKTESEK
ncbi:MAG: hypothetical protein IJU23_13715 [Proteobacteria bacterium]|nr:hypothetical protein [Pseudomonadota bacterium]